MMGWHSHSLYDELLLVPLLIKMPLARWANSTVANQVRSVDIAPTVVHELGLDVPKSFVGRRLHFLLEDELLSGDLPAVSSVDGGPRRHVSSLRTRDWKLYPNELRTDFEKPSLFVRVKNKSSEIVHPFRLFNLKADPQEQKNVRSRYLKMLRRMTRLIIRLEGERETPPPVTVIPQDDTVDQLKVLGYVEE